MRDRGPTVRFLPVCQSAEGETEATAVVTPGVVVTPVSRTARTSPTVRSTGEVIPGVDSHSGSHSQSTHSTVYVTPDRGMDADERAAILAEAAYGIWHAPMCSNVPPATQPYYRDLHTTINGHLRQQMQEAHIEGGGPDPGLPMTAVGNTRRMILRQLPSEYPHLTTRAYSMVPRFSRCHQLRSGYFHNGWETR